jgi:hypothetical protein
MTASAVEGKDQLGGEVGGCGDCDVMAGAVSGLSEGVGIWCRGRDVTGAVRVRAGEVGCDMWHNVFNCTAKGRVLSTAGYAGKFGRWVRRPVVALDVWVGVGVVCWVRLGLMGRGWPGA